MLIQEPVASLPSRRKQTPGRFRPGVAQRRRLMALQGEDLYEELGFEEAEGEAEGFEEEAEGFEEEAEGFEEEAEGFEEEAEGFEEDSFLRSALGGILGAEEEEFEEGEGFEEDMFGAEEEEFEEGEGFEEFEDEMAY